ncbi:carbohydrate porin [Pontiella agarivorans]|uniref:Carbohydrate porin n=1 Tax=Pontiella agarivorans TaxID=3038953 RepID=A0ABU5MX17_9BACT|nr:carbohydrate porin [Pontiella agarivorans]MDZ8118511.1 carbohydrate porin [Pontiella agarivorans]
MTNTTSYKGTTKPVFDNFKAVSPLRMLPLLLLSTWLSGPDATAMKAVPMQENDDYAFGISGYLRTGIGTSKGGNTQAAFQAPGPQNKYSLGNQADTYGELEFDYVQYLFDDKNKNIEGVWMVSGWEAFDSDSMTYNLTEQLYGRANNLFGNEIDLWIGRRFFERQAIHMLDRQWNNPGQAGEGLGIEGLLGHQPGEHDLKLTLFHFKDDDVISYVNGEHNRLHTYAFDARWVKYPLNDRWDLNASTTYSIRMENEELGYQTKHGFGASAWLDYLNGDFSNQAGLVVRQGANIPINHWNSASVRENPGTFNGDPDYVENDLDKAYSIELNNNWLYDNQESWALNIVSILQYRNHGTAPYEEGSAPAANLGDDEFWFSLGGRFIYYVTKQFRLSMQLSNDYVDNRQKDIAGNLSMITFTPEFSLAKGYYSRPVLRPFVTYATWSGDFRGEIGNGPGSAPYGNDTSGLTAGVQFEIWW